MGGTRAALLAQALEVAAGRAPVPEVLRPALSGETFDRLWRETLPDPGSPEGEAIRAVAELASRAAREIRGRHQSPAGGCVAVAERTLAEARERSAGLGRYAAAHCLSVVAGARAYLEYARDDWPAALAALAEANDADVVLLESGCFLMHLHRVQLLHNWARVEVRRRGVAAGLALGGLLVEHLQGGAIPEAPLAGPWHREATDRCPAELVAAMLVQVAGECSYWRYRQAASGAGIS